MSAPRILVVEGDSRAALDVERRISTLGYESAGIADSGSSALAMVANRRPDLVLIDTRLNGDMDCAEAAQEIRKRFETPAVFLASSTEESLLRFGAIEPFRCVVKPIDEQDLKAAVDLTLCRHRAEEEMTRLERLYSVIMQVSRAVTSLGSPEELFATVCRLLVVEGGADLAWVGKLNAATGQIEPVADFGGDGEFLKTARFGTGDSPIGQGTPGRAIREGSPAVCNDCGAKSCLYPGQLKPAQFGFQSCASFALRYQNEIWGILSIVVSRSGFFRERETKLFEEVAAAVSFALDKIEIETRRRQADAALRESEARFRSLFENSADGVGVFDLATRRCVVANPQLRAMLGYTEEQLRELAVERLHPASFRERAMAGYDSLAKQPWAHMQDVPVLRGNGVQFDADIRTSIFEMDGQPFLMAVFRDAAQRKRLEETTKTREQHQAALLSNLPGMAYRCRNDKSWTMEFVSNGCMEVTGYTPADLTKETARFSDLIHEDDRDYVWDEVQEALKDQRQYQLSYRIRKASGETRWVGERGFGIYDASGQVVALEGFIMDVTALRAAEAAREKYRLLLDQAQDIMLCVDPKTGRILEANEAAAEAYGYSQSELLSMSAFELRASEFPKTVAGHIAEALEGGVLFETVHRRRDGTEFPVEISSRAARLGDETLIVSFLRDITLRKRAENALLVSEGRMKALLGSMSDLVFVLNSDLVFEEFRQPRTSGLLLDPDMFIGKHVDAIGFPEPALGVIKDALIRTMQLRDQSSAEYCLDMGNRRAWFDLKVTSFEGPTGGPSGLTCVVRDVTERKQTEDAVRQQKDLSLALLAEHDLNEGLRLCVLTAERLAGMECGGIYLADDSGTLHLAYQDGLSPRFVAAVSCIPADAPSARWARLGQPYHGSFTSLGMADPAAEAEGLKTVSYVPVLHDRRLVAVMNLATRAEMVLTSAERLRFESIAHQAAVFIARHRSQMELQQAHTELEERVRSRTAELSQEIAERKQVEAQLRRAKEAADTANQAKSRFLANISHEIRTPMNAIIGFAQLLRRETGLTPRQQEQLQTINQSGEQLLRLITDVLDMAKLESGRMQLKPEECHLPSLLGELETLFRRRSEEKGLRFESLYAPDLPQAIYTDPAKVRQVLLNLLSNAVRFTPAGRIRLDASCTTRPDPNGGLSGTVSIQVCDTGNGIAPEDLERVFEPFEQEAPGRSQGGGAGLGLPICRQLARLLNGEIAVSSEVGSGSTFSLIFTAKVLEAGTRTVPAPKTPGTSSMERLKERAPGTRVLIVDDIQTNRRLLRSFLEGIGFTVLEAADGSSAVSLCASDAPNVILMDRRMPGMDGLAAVRAIRAGLHGDRPRILMVTGSVAGIEDEDLASAGADGLIYKPFRLEDLVDRLVALLGIDQAPVSGSDSETALRPFTRESAALLPAGLRRNLVDATEEGNRQELMRLIMEVVRPRDPELSRSLNALAANYDYVSILKALVE